MITEKQQDYLDSLSEKDRAYRESLSIKDRALYDYYSMSPTRPRNENGGYTLERTLGPELTVGDCTSELWAKIGHTG